MAAGFRSCRRRLLSRGLRLQEEEEEETGRSVWLPCRRHALEAAGANPGAPLPPPPPGGRPRERGRGVAQGGPQPRRDPPAGRPLRHLSGSSVQAARRPGWGEPGRGWPARLPPPPPPPPPAPRRRPRPAARLCDRGGAPAASQRPRRPRHGRPEDDPSPAHLAPPPRHRAADPDAEAPPDRGTSGPCGSPSARPAPPGAGDPPAEPPRLFLPPEQEFFSDDLRGRLPRGWREALGGEALSELTGCRRVAEVSAGQAPGNPPVQGPSHVVGWPDTRWPEFVEPLPSGKAAGDGKPLGAASACQPTEPCEPRETEARKGSADGGPESLEQNPPAHLQAQFPQGALLLTGLHACRDLSAILLRLFVACPHIVGITLVACCYMKPSTREGAQPGYPLSNWVAALPGHQLSYKAREGACYAMEDYPLQLEHDSPLLKTHCFRARLETMIQPIDPTKKRLGVQAIPKSHEMTFEQQVCLLGTGAYGDEPHGPLEPISPAQQWWVVVFFSLALLLARLAETLIPLNRMIYLQEQGFPCELIPLFNPALSARNLVLVAAKKVPPSHLWGLAAGD